MIFKVIFLLGYWVWFLNIILVNVCIKYKLNCYKYIIYCDISCVYNRSNSCVLCIGLWMLIVGKCYVISVGWDDGC